AYNQARFLTTAIESALGQTGVEVEVIVVNDGSTDNTAEVVAAYAGDTRFQCISQANAGLPAARNRGLQAATGEFVCFLDSDDFYAPEKSAKQVAALKAHPEAGFVYCDFTLVDEAGEAKPNQGSLNQLQRTLSGDIFPALIQAGYFPPHTVMIRRQVLAEVGDFDRELGGHADYDLWLRAAARHPAQFLDEKLAYYRDWGNSMSKNQEHMDATRVLTLQKLARQHPDLAGQGLHQLQKANEQIFSANQRLHRELYQALTRVPTGTAKKSGDQNYSLLLNHAMGTVTQGQPEQSAIWDVTVNGQLGKALMLQPPVELAFNLPTELAGVFTTEVALHPDVWEKPEAGACEFQIIVDRRVALSLVIDPKNLPADRRWLPVRVEVPPSPGGKHQLALRTRSQNGDNAFRWALWRNPSFSWNPETQP
ncbi:MAG TPA: glycosyltransferase, partial [Verrucomicrobiae bacterium]